MNAAALRESLEGLRQYVESENFLGYDPYDILGSPLPLKALPRYGAAIITQVHKRNPVNLRPVLGIRKGLNPKAAGLFLYGYSLLQQLNPGSDFGAQIEKLFAMVRDSRSPGMKHWCWGYNFGWAGPEKFLPANAPSGVVTAIVARGLHAYYRLSGNEEAKRMLLGTADFVRDDLRKKEMPEGVYFSYTPYFDDCCYNASLFAAEILAREHALTQGGDINVIRSAVDFVVSKQKEEGRWNYSLDVNSGRERKQIDFHQGYVIDSIRHIAALTKTEHPAWNDSVHRGAEFYMNHQFYPDGRSLWRWPVEYPVEIHNQSQGIITFSQLGDVDAVYPAFANVVAEWTISNMQDKRRKYFYYRKLRFYTNKISYIRWSNAWMFVGLVTILNNLVTQSSTEE